MSETIDPTSPSPPPEAPEDPEPSPPPPSSVDSEESAGREASEESSNPEPPKKKVQRTRGGLLPYPTKEDFQEFEFPRGLKHYGIFPLEEMWTDSSMSPENRMTYSVAKDVPNIGQNSKKAQQHFAKLTERSANSINRPLISPRNGTSLAFHFDPSRKSEDNTHIEKDYKKTLWHIADFAHELKIAMKTILGLEKLDAFTDMENVDLSDYKDRMGEVGKLVNKSVVAFRQMKLGSGMGILNYEGPDDSVWAGDRMDIELSGHVMSGVTSRVITDGTYLNRTYKTFSNCVYGETMPNQLDQIAKEIDLTPDDVIVDLGSGVGNVCMFFAAACKVNKVVGIEINETPARAADVAEAEFNRAAAWYGKIVSPLYFERADFTHLRFKKFLLEEATLIFVNNYAFEQPLMTKLNAIFGEILPFRPGGRPIRIISTKPLSGVTEDHKVEAEEEEANAEYADEEEVKEEDKEDNKKKSKKEITKPTLRKHRTAIVNRRGAGRDLTSTLRARKLNKVKGHNCSWTGKQVEFVMHTVDYRKLEKFYFDKKASDNLKTAEIEQKKNEMTDSSSESSAEMTGKKRRGRPVGSGKKIVEVRSAETAPPAKKIKINRLL